MNYRKFILEYIIILLLFSSYDNIYSKELHLYPIIAKNGGHHRGNRARIHIDIAPIYTDYDSDYLDYENDYPGCIPYYYHYGFPPSAFNFGLRVRRGRAYYYCPSGYYYNKSRYRDSRYRHMDRRHDEHRH